MPGQGPDKAYRVIVGEAPGEEEVSKGRPFVGVAGRRLDVALSAARTDRCLIYITNALLCHPSGKPPRPPTTAVGACRERLVGEIHHRMPSKVLALGGTAGRALTRRPIVIERDRGRDLPSHFLDSHIKVRVTYHPSPSSLNRHRERPRHFDKDVRWLREP